MGEVHRARDTRLKRDVALKVLPEAFARDPERMARFQREAEVLASLNHPNIAQIYGVEGGALVMELVEGEPLRAPQPIETALDYARQIADALETAHEKGITHRDLKPANIMITPQGVVKVLDFGLAAVAQSSGSDPSTSPTLTISPTHAGMILGTAAYMAPEQARGKAVDKRADIWAFGVVLYEMLTGEQLFQGETVSDTLAAVLTREPDLTRVPVKVRRLLQLCLQKDPKQRLQAIEDWRPMLEDVPEQVAPQAKGKLSWAVAGVLAVALAIALWAPWRAKRDLQPLIRLDVDLGSDVSLGPGSAAALSPDGTRIVYVSHSRLFTRRLDQPAAAELAGTEGALAPFFSPDGQWVAFFTAGKLRKVSVQGGAAISLSDAQYGYSGSWGDDGNIVASFTSFSGLVRVPSGGGAPTPIAELATGEAAQRWPQILPGGKAVLFTALPSNSGIDGANIEVMSLSDRRRRTVQRGGTFGRFLPSGHLVYLHNGTLFAVPFDLDRLETQGTPVPVLEKVAYDTRFGSAQFAFSQTGTLLYRSAGVRLVTVQWLDSGGKAQPLPLKSGTFGNPRLSPNGSRLALASAEDLWVYELQRETMTRLTHQLGASYPVWTPDGRHLAFQARTAGGIFWARSDGSGTPQPLTQRNIPQFPTSFTPDGKRLAFSEVNPEKGVLGVWTVPVESDGTDLRAGKPEVFLQTALEMRSARFSSDGRWLAYSSNESGTEQVYVRAFPDKGRKWQISNSGGMYPIFSQSGRELFFRNPDNQIMVAAYTVKGDSFLPDKPRMWSEKRLANVGDIGNYDLAPDGKRIVGLMPDETAGEQKAQNHVIFLLNFFDELKRRAPVERK
jgi:serine/threonine-protein kinase